jgi:hypothetical protein
MINLLMGIQLPNTIQFDSSSETKDDYLKRLYEIFTKDFYIDKVTFLGKRVLPEKYPEIDNRVGSFNHITKFDKSSSKLDFNRSKKIPWLAPILNNSTDPSIKCWETKVKKDTRVNVWYEPGSFHIVLQPKGEFYYLITAITKSGQHEIDKLNNEYAISKHLP